MFLGKGVLKICSKFIGEHLCWTAISIKLLCNFIEIALRHGCSSVNLLHIFRAPFLKNTYVINKYDGCKVSMWPLCFDTDFPIFQFRPSRFSNQSFQLFRFNPSHLPSHPFSFFQAVLPIFSSKTFPFSLANFYSISLNSF